MNCSVSVSIDAHIIFGGFLFEGLTLRYEQVFDHPIFPSVNCCCWPQTTKSISFPPKKSSLSTAPPKRPADVRCVHHGRYCYDFYLCVDTKKAEFPSHDALRPQGGNVQPTAIHLVSFEKVAAADT
jgi:hypothetical protein